MNGWLAQNFDYLAFLALVAAWWTGLAWWLRRTGRLGALPKLTWLLLALVLAGGGVAVNRAGRDAQRSLRQQVDLLLPFYVQEFQQMGHAQLPDNPPPDDPVYLRLIRAQLHWLKNNPSVADIYTLRRRADGAVFLVVDSETDYDHNGRYEGEREQRTKPGAIYPNFTPALQRAFEGEQGLARDIITNRWGRWIGAFAPLRDANGKVEGVLGVNFDANEWLAQRQQARVAWLWLLGAGVLLITGPAVVIAILRHELAARAKTESALREQSELRRQIFDRAPGGVALTDLDYRFLKVNEAFCQMFGYTREELLRLTFVQITHPDDVARTIAHNQQVASGGVERVQVEKRYIRKDGSILEATVSGGLIRDASGNPKYLVGQISDISERRHAESELLVRQKQLGAILANTPVILFATDAHGRYTLCDGAGLAALGRKPNEVVGQSAFDLYAARPDLVADFRRALAGETFTSQRELNDAVFELRCTPLRETDGRIIGMIGIALDITSRVSAARDREKMERKLLEVQKLESLGVLAGGVAHDFNNLLTSILGNAGLIRLALGDTSPVLSNLTQIEQASQTAASLCQQLLAYAGRGRLDTSELDLSKLVRETTDLLHLSVGNHAQLSFNLAPALPGIVADPAQLRQVLLNIVLNAAEAIGRRDGLIEVTTRMEPLDAAWLAEARTGQDLAPGEYVLLDVRDNGPGLDALTQTRVFDPFFSTKGSGRGLGLAAALGIMRSHQGALRLRSQPGQGTRFTLAFPVQPKLAGEKTAGGPHVRHWRGRGSVLIVDDEEAVRATAAQMIAYFGFDVRQAESGQQALDLLRASPAAFDLVLLDLTMPGMDGYATFTALRQLRPGQRIVIFSGYSAHDARERFAGQNLDGFLQKPFSANSLREVLEQVAPK